MLRRTIATLSAAALFAACGEPTELYLTESSKPELGEEEQRFSSAQATLLIFEFDGELYAPGSVWSPRSHIDEQLLYTIGQLNWNKSVGRLDTLELSNIQKSAQPDGTTRVTYHAKLEVAWGSKTNLPTSYQLVLPRKTGSTSLDAFVKKYGTSCVDWGAHDVDAGSMWYYYRPQKSGCSLADADVVKLTASAVKSTENTTGKYPEYHRVWADDVLEVIAIFGKYEDGATTSSDAGIAAYNKFVAALKTALGTGVVTTPASVPTSPGIGMPDITFESTLAGGKKVKIVALLVDNVRTAPESFYQRYEALSPSADVIMYNGHAGLGSNVRALARRGKFVPGHYLMMFMNGCDTYAYVDGYMAEERAKLNADDPSGTKYLDIVTNAMPSFFHSMPNASMALIKSLLKHDAPQTYEAMFKLVDSAQVIVVTGEEDNVYYPGYEEPTGGFTMTEKGFVSKDEELRYETPALPPGKYTFTLAHDAQNPGGDADLYVKIGAVPTLSGYDCRPYKDGTNETCVVTVTTTAKIHIGVIGYASQNSHFTLKGEGEGGTTPPPAGWAGLDQQGTVVRSQEARFETGLVPAGKYTFTLSGTGDADLYVRAGSAPTTSSWDCRPYLNGSAEQCVVNLSTPGNLFVMVRGYASSSTFRIIGAKE